MRIISRHSRFEPTEGSSAISPIHQIRFKKRKIIIWNKCFILTRKTNNSSFLKNHNLGKIIFWEGDLNFQSNNQSINQSTNQSINLSITWIWPCKIHRSSHTIRKRSLKKLNIKYRIVDQIKI